MAVTAAKGARSRKPPVPKARPEPEAASEDDDLFAGTLEDEGEGADEGEADAVDTTTLDDLGDEGFGEDPQPEAPAKPARPNPPRKGKAQPAGEDEAPAEEAQLSADPSQQPVEAEQQPAANPVPQAAAVEPVTPDSQKLADRFRAEVQRANNELEGEAGEPEDYDTAESTGLAAAGSMFDLADTLRQAGFRLGLQNIRKQMLDTLENFGLINECKKIAKIPSEAMTSVTGSFVQGGKLIPAMMQLGWKPVHRTGIDANYPVGEKYQLTMTNGSLFVTVRGVVDWESNVNFTEIRYATDSELRQFGLLADVDDSFGMATASAARPGSKIEHLPSVQYYGRAVASSLLPILSPAMTAMRRDGALCDRMDGFPLGHGDLCSVPLQRGLCDRASILGLMPDESGSQPAAVLVLVDDGYALVDPSNVLRGVMQ